MDSLKTTLLDTGLTSGVLIHQDVLSNDFKAPLIALISSVLVQLAIKLGKVLETRFTAKKVK